MKFNAEEFDILLSAKGAFSPNLVDCKENYWRLQADILCQYKIN